MIVCLRTVAVPTEERGRNLNGYLDQPGLAARPDTFPIEEVAP